MDKNAVVRATEEFVKNRLADDRTGHDWWHVARVLRNALLIAEHEGPIDLFVVRLAALLHDVADWKFVEGGDAMGEVEARVWLEELGVQGEVTDHVCQIVADISFKGSGVEDRMPSLEGMVVQDADRLDALGAIGIARAFSYGGFKGQEIHDPAMQPMDHRTFEEYKNTKGSTINHFYEKLLLLEDRMNTPTGKRMARARTQFMEDFLARFFEEWQGP